MAHEAVLNAIAQEVPVLPMRFGAVVTDDDAVADELLKPHQDYFLRALDQLRGHLEFRLRGDYNQDVILTRIVEADPRIQQLREKIAGRRRGRELLRPHPARRGRSRRRWTSSGRRTRRPRVDALSKFAVATEVKEAGGENGAVHLAFLVQHRRT